MSEWTILEHTADMGFRVRGASRDELFVNAAVALVSIVMDASRAAAAERHEIAFGGEDDHERLVNWLNEVLWLLDGKRVAPARIEPGVVWGEPRDDARHPPRLVVKAVTFHQLSVREDNGHWEAEVFLDV